MGDSGGNTFNVQGFVLNDTFTINGGSGNDTFNLSSNAPTNTGDLGGFAAASIAIDAQGGSNMLNFAEPGATGSGSKDLAPDLGGRNSRVGKT
jgi:hypothetical protein